MHLAREDTIEALAESKAFRGVERSVLEALARAGRIERAPAHARLLEQGSASGDMLFVVSGAVRFERTVAGAEEGLVLEVARGPYLVPDGGSGARREGSPWTVSTMRQSVVLRVPAESMAKLASGDVALERAVAAAHVELSRALARRADELALGTVAERLERLLQGLAERHGSKVSRGRLYVAIPLRRRDIARMLASTTETASRTLAKLERQGRVRSTRDGLYVMVPVDAPSEPGEPT